MRNILTLATMLLAPLTALHAAEKTPYQDDFTRPLGKEWFWGLGTWTAKNGVLRGFESGPRRHGPVKMLNLAGCAGAFGAGGVPVVVGCWTWAA